MPAGAEVMPVPPLAMPTVPSEIVGVLVALETLSGAATPTLVTVPTLVTSTSGVQPVEAWNFSTCPSPGVAVASGMAFSFATVALPSVPERSPPAAVPSVSVPPSASAPPPVRPPPVAIVTPPLVRAMVRLASSIEMPLPAEYAAAPASLPVASMTVWPPTETLEAATLPPTTFRASRAESAYGAEATRCRGESAPAPPTAISRNRSLPSKSAGPSGWTSPRNVA